MANEPTVTQAYQFDRYINGELMAEGVTIERETTLHDAARAAARIAPKGPHGETPVLVLAAHRHASTAELRAENERYRQALRDAVLQLEYLDERHPTGSTPATIARINGLIGGNDA